MFVISLQIYNVLWTNSDAGCWLISLYPTTKNKQTKKNMSEEDLGFFISWDNISSIILFVIWFYFSFICLHCFCLQASHQTHSLLILTTTVDKQRSGAKYTWPWQTNGGHPAGVWHLHPWSWIGASADNAWRVWQCLWSLGEDHCSTFK